MSGDRSFRNRHLVGRLSGMARQMEMTARASLGTGCGFVLSPDGAFWVQDGMGGAFRLELALPRMWHTDVPDYLRRAVIEPEFGGRDCLGRPTSCGRCGQKMAGGVLMVVEGGHPLCDACAGRVAPLLRRVCDAARDQASETAEQLATDKNAVTRALADARQSLKAVHRALTDLMGALPEPAFAPGTDAPLNRSAQLYALLTTLLHDHLESALTALRQAEKLGEMMAEGR